MHLAISPMHLAMQLAMKHGELALGHVAALVDHGRGERPQQRPVGGHHRAAEARVGLLVEHLGW
eukprot:scaffold66515_cov66-Phaeocystis_antarctica.AAC.1